MVTETGVLYGAYFLLAVVGLKHTAASSFSSANADTLATVGVNPFFTTSIIMLFGLTRHSLLQLHIWTK